jgi:hypothetical protein
MVDQRFKDTGVLLFKKKGRFAVQQPKPRQQKGLLR